MRTNPLVFYESAQTKLLHRIRDYLKSQDDVFSIRPVHIKETCPNFLIAGT